MYIGFYGKCVLTKVFAKSSDSNRVRNTHDIGLSRLMPVDTLSLHGRK